MKWYEEKKIKVLMDLLKFLNKRILIKYITNHFYIFFLSHQKYAKEERCIFFQQSMLSIHLKL